MRIWTGVGWNVTRRRVRSTPIVGYSRKLAEDYPELELARFTKHDLRTFLKRWEDRSAATRANVVSVLHSFFGWAAAEDLVEVDPLRPSPSAEEASRSRLPAKRWTA